MCPLHNSHAIRGSASVFSWKIILVTVLPPRGWSNSPFQISLCSPGSFWIYNIPTYGLPALPCLGLAAVVPQLPQEITISGCCGIASLWLRSVKVNRKNVKIFTIMCIIQRTSADDGRRWPLDNVLLWQLCLVGLKLTVIAQMCRNDGGNLIFLPFQYL